jgi:hypothetical protein
MARARLIRGPMGRSPQERKRASGSRMIRSGLQTSAIQLQGAHRAEVLLQPREGVAAAALCHLARRFGIQIGTTPRTARNIIGNERGPSGRPRIYPARTCSLISSRNPSGDGAEALRHAPGRAPDVHRRRRSSPGSYPSTSIPAARPRLSDAA